MRTLPRASALAPAAAFCLLAACAAREPQAPPPAQPPPRPQAEPARPPVLAADSPRSGLRAAASPASGEALFRLHCAPCHGDDATGGGRFWSSTQEPLPPPLAGPNARATTAEALAESIAEGRHRGPDDSLCPPFGTTLSPRDVGAIVEFLLAAR